MGFNPLSEVGNVMSAVVTIIEVYKPNARKHEARIRSLIPRQTFDALRERLGEDAGKKAEAAHRTLLRVDGDMIQFRTDDGHRVRVKQEA